MPSASASSSSSPNPGSSRRSHEESRRRTSQEDGAELIPLPELNRSRTSLSEKRGGGGFGDVDEDEDEEDDLVVHESQGLLADEADSDTKHPSASPTSSSRNTRSTRPRPRPRALAINRAWRKKLASLTSHKHYPYFRLSFFALLTLGALLLATFSLRSAFHVTTSHAPGSTSSSSHPPTNEALLATSLQSGEVLSNGTHEWRKTVVLISLDGVKPDYVRGYRLKNVARLGLGDGLFDVEVEKEGEEEEEHEGGALIPGGIATNHSQETNKIGETPPPAAGAPSIVPGRPIPGRKPVGHLLASSMLPIHPTLTFPNHWSLLTGLHASSHGIIANDFHIHSQSSSSNFKEGRQFYYSDPARSWNSGWWGGEPLWATAERAGIPTAVHMWPGPPVTSQGDRPRYFREYEEGLEWDGRPENRIRDVLGWLGKGIVSTRESAGVKGGADVRPQLICVYFPDVDKAAHIHGPESSAVYEALAKVDGAIGLLRDGLRRMNVQDIVDLVVVSDHGMAETSAPGTEKVVYLDRVLGKELWSKIEYVDGYPSRGIRFRRPAVRKGWFFGLLGGGNEEEVRKVEGELYERARALLLKERERLVRASLGWSGPFQVYRREELPKEWHLNDGRGSEGRLAPLWVVPTEGWGFTDEKEMEGWGGVFRPKGNHGYPLFDPFSAHPDPLALKRSMHAIFAASGPSFLKSKQNPLVNLTHHTASHVGWNMPVLGHDSGGEGDGAASPAQGLGAVGSGAGKGRVDGAGTGAALRNLEVYDLVCRLLGVPRASRAPNNGTASFWDDYVDRP
ncbi:hypothetical protein CF327_g2123 [Tilletia walkeri]|nr:hypothetical protein CF327_g2123 [Tilletia walkeri]